MPPYLFLSSDSDQQCQADGIRVFPLGEQHEKATGCSSSLELFTCVCALLCSQALPCRLTKYNFVGTALSPALTVGKLATGSDVFT